MTHHTIWNPLLLTVATVWLTALAVGQAPPKVVKLEPANRSVEVDAAKTTRLVIEFDRPMSRNGFSICGGGPQFPKVTKRPRWKGSKTLVVEVELKPDHSYRMSLNCPSAKNFRSAKGQPLVPVAWTFTTLPTRLRTEKEQRARNEGATRALRDTLAAKYSYYEHKKIDWKALFDQNRKALHGARTDRGWAAVVGRMLAVANDLHMYLRVDGQTIGTGSRRVDPLYRPQRLRQYLGSISQPTPGVTTAKTKDGIVYLMISGWSRKIDFDDVAEWIAANQNAKAMIIDVRPNSGGEERLARGVAQWFVEGTKTYAKHATRKGAGANNFYNVSQRKIRGKPKNARFGKPVAVLMSRYCMSSNEAFLLMMRQAEKSKLIGQTSYGSSGNPRGHKLPNGVEIVLPSWKVMRLDGTVFEDQGLKPDLEIVPTAAELETRDPILEKALEHLRSEKSDVREAERTRIKLPAKKKILFLSGRRSHGYGSHEFNAGNLLMAKLLESRFEGLTTQVFLKGAWPEPKDFQDVDSVVIFCDGGGGHMVNKRLDQFDRLMKQGVGAAFLHYGVETVKGRPSAMFIEWIGGHFERFWSVNPHWVAKFDVLPEHPITRGVRPFLANDEWYFHMRFRPKMAGVTPILSAIAPPKTMRRKDGPHSGNPDVRKAVKARIPQHLAWAFERRDGGRGFGFTGLHRHWNFADDDFRKTVLNAIAWTAKIEIPRDGIVTPTPTQAELEANQDYPKPDAKKKPKHARKGP
jgi:Peptidase family S41/Trehalose utilisation